MYLSLVLNICTCRNMSVEEVEYMRINRENNLKHRRSTTVSAVSDEDKYINTRESFDGTRD